LKKAQLALVGIFITAVLAVVLLAYLLIPVVKGTTDLVSSSDSYARTNNSLNESKTLTHTYGVTVSSVANSTLTLPVSNYTVSGGVVTFLQDRAPVATYTISYTYQNGGYLDDMTNRVLMGLVIIASLLGLIYWLLTALGVI
jgi:predicted PurR-regulated permease PerM